MKLFKFIAGPETLWIIIYLFSVVMSKLNKSGRYNFDKLFEDAWLILPGIAFISFIFYWIPFVDKSWLLFRIWVITLVISHLALSELIDSHSQQGPGVGTIYLAGMIFIFIALSVGSIAIFIIQKL